MTAAAAMRAVADAAAARTRAANVMAHYRATRDASSDPDSFPFYFLGALSVMVPAELWELAIEAAQDTDRREAMKAAAS